MIHRGFLNGTPVAIKKIFDPRLTDELLQEIQNERVMQSILRHPNIAILMGVIPKIMGGYVYNKASEKSQRSLRKSLRSPRGKRRGGVSKKGGASKKGRRKRKKRKTRRPAASWP